MEFESTQKLKILFTHRFNHGGGFVYTHYLCNMLVELGCDVTCISLKERFIDDKPAVITDARYKVVWLDTFLVIQPWQLKRFIKSYLRKRTFDVIVSTGSEGVYLQTICSKRGIPHIASYYNCDPSYKVNMRDLFQLKWLNPFNFGKWCWHLYLYFEWQRLKRADLVHCISKWQKNAACKHLNIPEKKIVVIYGGVDLKEFSPAPDIKKSGILYCGRLVRDKGIDNLLEAFSIVRKRHNVSLNIVGPGKWQPYREKAITLGIDKDVNYIGYVPRIDVSKYFKKACLFITPAKSEGFGLTVAEAFASGLPVIATLSSAIPEIVEDGVTGILVPWNDSNALADAMIRLLDNPELAKSMGEKGRASVEKRFIWEETAQGLINAIEKMRREKDWPLVHSHVDIAEIVKWILKDHPWSGSRNFVKAMKAYGGLNMESYIIDIGCSSGKIGLAAALKTGCKLTCLDRYESGIILARKVYEELRQRTGETLEVDFVEGDIQNLPYQDQFDLVFNEGVIEHWPDRISRLNAISQMVKSAKPGGKVLIWVPNKRNSFYWFYKRMGYNKPAVEEWLFTPEELRELMIGSGLDDVRILGFQPYLSPFYLSSKFISKLKPLAMLLWLIIEMMPSKIKKIISLKYSFEIIGVGQKPGGRILERSD